MSAIVALLQTRRQFAPRPKQHDFNRRPRLSQYFCNIAERHIFDVMEPQRRVLFFRKNFGSQVPNSLVTFRRHHDLQRFCLIGRRSVEMRAVRNRLGSPMVIDARAAGDGKQPGRKRPAAVITMQVFVGPAETSLA